MVIALHYEHLILMNDLFRCNNKDDCGDGSDESMCSCPERNMFKCLDGPCIAEHLRCDSNPGNFKK